VSPDGSLFVYAAHQGRRLGTSVTGAWTAVSRLPWLHALTLWPMGTTYGGGGRFVGDRRLVLRGASAAHPEHPLSGLEVVAGEAPLHRSSGEVEGAAWSGRDPRGRLVFARDGQLFARAAPRDRQGAPKDQLLHDFCGDAPAPVPAPPWAQAPLRARVRSGPASS
jgi:hypothetical protein